MSVHKTDHSVGDISRSLCTGCMMCGDICPKKAISFPMSKGNWYPKVDEDTCINCGLCKKRCPALNVPKSTQETPVACYGARTKQEDIRKHSTSGGFFTELAKYWISQGGYCAGAIYGEDNEIIHANTKDVDDLGKFRQSKYAQSKTSSIYQQTQDLLKRGEKVLFCGTPCQVEALFSFLGKEYENLLTMDFVCLGICSPFAYRKYLDMLEKDYHSKVVRVWFKNKTNGWRAISTRVDFENGKTYLEPGGFDLFMRAFVTDGLTMRPNCQNCKFRKVPHASDFTLGDFWGVEKINPEQDDNKGLSAVMVNTPKGQEVFETIKDSLFYFQTTASDICAGNFSILKPMRPHPRADEFMVYLETHSFSSAVYKYGSLSRREMVIKRIKRTLRALLRGK